MGTDEGLCSQYFPHLLLCQIAGKANQAYKLRKLISCQPTCGKISGDEEIKGKWQ